MKAAIGQCVDRVDISQVAPTYYSCLLAAFNNPQLSFSHLSCYKKPGSSGIKTSPTVSSRSWHARRQASHRSIKPAKAPVQFGDTAPLGGGGVWVGGGGTQCR